MSDEMEKALKADGEKLRGLTGMDHGPFHIPEDAFSQPDPLAEMRDQMMANIAAKLAEGVPVTLTLGDRKICTFHPNGTTEHHDF